MNQDLAQPLVLDELEKNGDVPLRIDDSERDLIRGREWEDWLVRSRRKRTAERCDLRRLEHQSEVSS